MKNYLTTALLILTLSSLDSVSTLHATTSPQALDLQDVLSVSSNPSVGDTNYAAQWTLTSASGTIHRLQVWFYSSSDCSGNPLNTASIVDNGPGIAFTAGQTAKLSATSAYTLANNKGITMISIGCMKAYIDGGNESPLGAACQLFAEDCFTTPSECTSNTTTPFVSWANNPTACATRYAYIANNNDSTITQCTIQNSDGTLSCIANEATGLNSPEGLDINNGYIYISTSNSSTTVKQFTVSATNGMLATLVNNTAGNNPLDVTLNGNYVYIGQNLSSTSILFCPINPSNGQIATCNSTGDLTFNNIYAIAFNNGYAYIGSFDGGSATPSVTVCTLAPLTGQLSSCVQQTSLNTNLGSNLNGLAINNNYVYISNFLSILVCPIQSGGSLSFSSCVSSNYNNFPNRITFFNNSTDNNDYAYVTSGINSAVYRCTVNPSDGTFVNSSCASVGSNFNIPHGIAIY